jgi:hypothetical protein
MAVFWVVEPCSLVDVYQRFRGPCCLHNQGKCMNRIGSHNNVMFRCVETVGNYIQKYWPSHMYSKSKLRNALPLCRSTNWNVHSNHFDQLVSNLTLCDQGVSTENYLESTKLLYIYIYIYIFFFNKKNLKPSCYLFFSTSSTEYIYILWLWNLHSWMFSFTT